VRVMAGHATQLSVTVEVALRLRDPDRLEPRQCRVVGVNQPWRGPGWVSVTLSTECQLRFRGPAFRTEGHGQIHTPRAGVGHVCSGRPMAAFARDIRNQVLNVEPLIRCGRDPRGVATKAFEGHGGIQRSSDGGRAFRGIFGSLAWRDCEGILLFEVREPVFHCGRD